MSAPRVLVVEDDHATQRILRMFLEKSGYEPVFASTGKAGLEEARKPDAPTLVLLDWMLPDIDGPTVCRQLREAKLRIRPYVIFLSSKQDKTDIAAALDSGADDFLGKPFNVAEAQARLRVARRTVDYQRELRAQIEQNESLSQRNQILQEMMSKQDTRLPFAGSKKEKVEPAKSAPGKFSIQELRFTLSAAFLEAKLALESVQSHPPGLSAEQGNLLAWSGFSVVKTGHWVDVVLSSGIDQAQRLFTGSLRREARTEVEILSFLAELARIVGQGFARATRGKHGETAPWLMSKGLHVRERASKLPIIHDGESFELGIEGVKFVVTVCVTAGARKAVATGALKPFDVLASAFPPPSLSAVPIFMEGVVLSSRFIEKLAYQTQVEALGGEADVWRPSGVATYFHQEE